MSWTVIKNSNEVLSRKAAFISVGHNKMTLNTSACELLGDYDKYRFVQFLTDPDRPSVIGMQFLTENTVNSISIKRKEFNGKKTGGFEIGSKYFAESLFGQEGTKKEVTRYPVIKDNDTDNILIIQKGTNSPI